MTVMIGKREEAAMSHRVVATEPDIGVAGSWAGSVFEGQARLRYLASAAGLRDAAAMVSSAASELGCQNVMAASPNAVGAVAAATVLDPSLRTCDIGTIRAGQVDKILLVETVAVTGRWVRQSAANVNEAGVSWVAALILYPPTLGPASDLRDRLGLEELDAVVCH